MSAASKAAREWLNAKRTPTGAQVAVITTGIAISRQTGVAHYVTDAAEITVDGVTNLAASWMCGGSSVDAMVDHDGAVECVGCQIAASLPQCPVVYFAIGADEELLYVGSTIQAATRIRTHARSTHWWPEVTRLDFEEHDTEEAARRAEAAVLRENPGCYNIRGVNFDGPKGLTNVLSLISEKSA